MSLEQAPQILITTEFHKNSLATLEKKFDNIKYLPNINDADLLRHISCCSILIAGTKPDLSRNILQYGKKLKLIIRLGIGVDHIDLQFCRTNNIMVCNTPGSNTMPVVELVFSQLIRLLRKVDNAQNNFFNGSFRAKLPQGEELAGKTIGVIGTGRIGSKICALGNFFQMQVLGYDPYISDHKRQNIQAKLWPSLEDLLNKSDIVTLHVPLTNETKNLVNENFLEFMKPAAVLINTSRGKVVDFNAVIKHCRHNKSKHFIFDVYDEEPFSPADYNLSILPPSLFTPHIGAYTLNSLEKRSNECLIELSDFFENKKPHGLIDPIKGY